MEKDIVVDRPARCGFVLKDANIAIYPAPKAARTSIMNALGRSYKDLGLNLRLTVKSLKSNNKNTESCYKIGVCRNPWTRLQSLYVNKLVERSRPTKPFRDLGFYTNMPFSQFIHIICSLNDEESEKHTKSQYLTIYQAGNIDWLIKYENLFAEWRNFRKFVYFRSGRNILNLKRLNATKKSYPEWTSKLIDAVSKRYSIDIELFKYEYEG